MNFKSKTDGFLSYSSTTGDFNPLPLTTRERLLTAAKKKPNDIAYIFHKTGLELSFKALTETAKLMAQNFLHLNLKKSDRIVYLLPNCEELLYSYFAASLIGLISVPLDVDYGPNEVSYMIEKTEPTAIVFYYSDEYKAIIDELFPNFLNSNKKNYRSNKFPSIQTIIVMNDESLNVSSDSHWTFDHISTKKLSDIEYELPDVETDDVFAILFTSGTTSRPKGTIITYFSMMNNVHVFNDYDEKIKISLNFCQTSLMCHIGEIGIIMRSLNSNYRLVFPSYKFDLQAILESIEKYKCQSINGLPKILNNMIDSPLVKNYDLSSLTSVTCGGSFAPIRLIKRLRDELKIKYFFMYYGMTEIGLVSYNLVDPENEIIPFRIFPFIECKIADPITGLIKPIQSEGELHVRGFTVTRGYWNDPELTDKLIDPNKWLNTGDIMTMDKHGSLYFKSRSKEIIIAKGSGRLDCYPCEIEEVISRNEKVSQVAVFGVKLNDYEHEVCAWIKLKSDSMNLTLNELRVFCKGKLTDYKIPTFIKIVNEIPSNFLGKYLKSEMEKATLEEMNANAEKNLDHGLN